MGSLNIDLELEVKSCVRVKLQDPDEGWPVISKNGNDTWKNGYTSAIDVKDVFFT